MSNYIVLLKQVPDVLRIGDDAFDKITGNLKRGELECVINDLDAQALAFANAMKLKEGAGKIIALTMGPSSAQDVLEYALARCADEGVLLCDSLLAGSDTWASAKGLGFGCRKIISDILGSDEDLFIISGMQSVDGDTAQVPAELACELDASLIAYATEPIFEDNEFSFRVIDSKGNRVVKPRKKIALVTVAKFDYLFASFEKTRRARNKGVIEFQLEGVDPSNVGVKGSKTQVVRVFRPQNQQRRAEKITSIESLAQNIIESINSQSHNISSYSKQSAYKLPEDRESPFDRRYEAREIDRSRFSLLEKQISRKPVLSVDMITDDIRESLYDCVSKDISLRQFQEILGAYSNTTPSYSGDVCVVLETCDEGLLTQGSKELIGEANFLSRELGVKAVAILLTHKETQLTKEIIALGVDKVYIVKNELFEVFDPGLYSTAFREVLRKTSPQITLFNASVKGRCVAPLVAYELGCGLTADCTSFAICDNSAKNMIAVLYQTRPALGGNVMATIVAKNSPSQMATVRAGVMMPRKEDYSRDGEVVEFSVNLTQADKYLDVISKDQLRKDIELDAEVIVSGGRGLLSKDNYESLILELSRAIENVSGVKTQNSASRSAVEHGFADRARQVGQTGSSISPRLYLAIGISGAIQHMIGVANAETIIAINSDPDAKINSQCDYYYTAKAQDIIPLLIEAIENIAKSKGGADIE